MIKKKMVTLNPAESTVVSFEVIPTEPRLYQVSVDGLMGNFKAKTLTYYELVAGDMTILDITGKPFVEVGKDPDGIPYGVLRSPKQVSAYTMAVASWAIHWRIDTTPTALNHPLTYELLPEQPAKYLFILTFYDSNGVFQGTTHQGDTGWFSGINRIVEGVATAIPLYGYPGEMGPDIYSGKFEMRLLRGGALQWNLDRGSFRVKNMLRIG